MKTLVEKIYTQKDEFLIIGLTGKTGSGCTTVADIFRNGYKNYNDINELDKPLQKRKDRIIKNYAKVKFAEKKFTLIKPSTIMMMLFIFEKGIFFNQLKELKKLLEQNDESIKMDDKTKFEKDVDIECDILIKCTIQREKRVKKVCRKILELYKVFTSFKDVNNFLDNNSLFEQNLNNVINNYSEENKQNLLSYIVKFKKQYEKKLLQQTLKELKNELNYLFGSHLKRKDLKFKKLEFKKLNYSKANIEKKYKIRKQIVNKILKKLATDNPISFISLYDKYNQAISKKRKSSELSIEVLQEIGDLVRSGIDIFQLPQYVNLFIKSYRSRAKEKKKPCYIVIDSLKNPFEIVFFKERYSAYYTFSIHATNEVIYDRFSQQEDIDIKSIHKKEINQDDSNKQKDSLSSKKDFNSQNIIECIQRSDIYIDNNQDKKDTLYKQIFKYLSLIVHPGLITPSKDEMIMQLALNAKFNSGCISRQVGAVVLNKYDSVRAVGWNEVPEGQTPCVLRSHSELLNNSTLLDYSHYEKTTIRKDHKFKYIFHDKKNIPQYRASNKLGLNDSFCFKQVQNDIDGNKNQVYTRSLHAEENAFLQASKYGNTEIIGGQLFTTASPCFLCAKKAYQLGMKRIIYIEAYPDISKEQVFDIGKNKIEMVHFRGAIGQAYHKLYEPIFSYKNELKAINSY